MISYKGVTPTALAASLVLLAASAQAAVEISPKPTRNISCSGGACVPTAKKAVLNIADLAGMLASGDTKVISDRVASDIDVKAVLSWASSHRLTLDAYHSIVFERLLTVAGDDGPFLCHRRE